MTDENGNRTPREGPEKSPSPAPVAQAGSGAGGGARIMKSLAGLASKLGLGKGKTEEHGVETGDVGTRLAHERTDLALERNYLASERTLMGWIRTALSMISFGFTIGKLGQVLNDVSIKGFRGSVHTVSIESIAHFLVVLGTVALLGAALQHRRRIHQLYAMGFPRQLSMTFIVALMLTAVGVFALGALVLAL